MRAECFDSPILAAEAPTEIASRTRTWPADPVDGPVEPEAVLFLWGPLRVLQRVGGGSGGDVYRAYDPALQTEVALKLKRAGSVGDRSGTRRFLEEARRLAQVRHLNVLAIHGADEHEGRAGIWTDFIQGCTLEEYIRLQGPLSACEATMIGLDLCRALAAVHGRRLVHRDVKASNVMREQGGRILLMDFGCVAEVSPAGEAKSGGLTGTPLTMAPEQLRGHGVSARSDIYALGALLYRLVTCRYPIEGNSVPELALRHEQRTGTPLRDRRPDLPVEFVQVVERALEPDADRRYPTAGAMEQALRASIAGAPLAAPDRFRAARRALILGVGVIAGFVTSGWLWPRLATQDFEAHSRDASLQALYLRPPAPPGKAAPLEAKASLFRHTGARNQRISRGTVVKPGDRLFLEVSVRQAMHTYVLDEDDAGAAYVLFPIPGISPENPLPPDVPQRLPGRMGDSLAYWTVTSSGGREGIIVIGSRAPLRELEQVISRLPLADPERPIQWSPARVAGGRRSIGGIHKEWGTSRDTHRMLHQTVQALEERGRDSGDVWIWRVNLNERYTSDANTAR